MSDHVVEHPEFIDGCRRIRDLFRRCLPNGREGTVLTDADLIVRWFGPRYGLDDVGMLAIVEIKYADAPLKQFQVRTLKLLDQLLRSGLPDEHRYRGCYLLHDYGDDSYRFHLQPDHVRLTEEQVVGWANLEWEAPVLFGPSPLRPQKEAS